MTDITPHETEQIDQANASGRTPGRVRARAVAAAEQLGPLAHGVRGRRLHDARAGLARRSEHGRRGASASRGLRAQDRRSDRRSLRGGDRQAARSARPSIGHSFGGLLAQILAGRGVSDATVAIDPAPFRGVLPLPISALKSASPVLGNPANHGRAVPLTYEQFRYAFANAVSEDEAQELYNTYAVPGSGVPLFQAATANLNPWTEAKVKSKNPEPRPAAHPRRRARPHRARGRSPTRRTRSRSATRA